MEKLLKLVGTLDALPAERCEVRVLGTSSKGIPIHHVRFGAGRVKALFVAGPHCPEQIGSLTVFGLLTLLKQGNRHLLDADVEWHIVPCIDPDGAVLNEGWSQKPFTFERFLRHHYEQPSEDQVDRSFPIRYRKWRFDEPSREAKLLQSLFDRIEPDFYYTLHNSMPTGGAWCAISRNIGQPHYRRWHRLLKAQGIPLRKKTPGISWCRQLAPGVSEFPLATKFYDYLHALKQDPGSALKGIGAGSGDYALQRNKHCLVFCSELAYIKHPAMVSDRKSRSNLKHLKLQIDADNKFIASAILTEWESVAKALDRKHPLYLKIFEQLIKRKDSLASGIWEWNFVRPDDLLRDSAEDRTATENEVFHAVMQGGYMFLCNAYAFVRLLKVSERNANVRRAIRRLEPVFAEVYRSLMKRIAPARMSVIGCNTLMKAQLGSGLIALDALLADRGRERARE